MNKFIHGGFFAKYRGMITASMAVLSAVSAYAIGDTDVFVMLQTIIGLIGIYFLEKSDNKNKGQK